jgi:hypothetical protein
MCAWGFVYVLDPQAEHLLRGNRLTPLTDPREYQVQYLVRYDCYIKILIAY